MAEARRTGTAAVAVTALLAGLVSALGGLHPSVAVAAAPASAGPGTYVAVPAVRILDTRSGVGVPAARVAAHGSIALAVTGVAAIPSTAAVSAVVFNLTATDTTANGYVSVYPAGAPAPATSSLNYSWEVTRAHSVVVAPGAGGKVTLHNAGSGSLDLIADVAGYYTAGTPNAGGEFAPLTSARLLDTRIGVGAPQAPMRHGVPLQVQLAGRGGIPSTGVSAVMLNVTVTQSTASGSLNATSPGDPFVGDVNFAAGQTVSNLIVVPVSDNGTIVLLSFMNGDFAATVQAVADVAGYFRAGAPSAPGRFGSLDTAALVDSIGTDRPVSAHGTLSVTVSGQQGIPLTGITAAMLNITVAAPKGSGHVTAYPSGTSLPATSTVNFAGQTASNLVVAAVGSDGKVRFYNDSSAAIFLAIDVSGFVGPIPGPLTWSARTPLPAATEVDAVSCASATFCVATGDNGSVLVFNGATWSLPQTLTTDSLDAISCPAAGFCVAVSYSAAYVDHAGTWTRTTIPPGLASISCRSATFCLASGSADEAHAWVFNGATWTSTGTGIPQSTDEDDDPYGMIVTCASATLCLGAAEDGPTARFNGVTWTALSTLSPSVSAMSCPSTTRCLATSGSQVATFDGTTWGAPVPLPDPSPASTRLSCGSTTFCVAVTGGADLQFYNGSTWTTQVTVDAFGVRDISCPTITFCLAVNASDSIAGTQPPAGR